MWQVWAVSSDRMVVLGQGGEGRAVEMWDSQTLCGSLSVHQGRLEGQIAFVGPLDVWWRDFDLYQSESDSEALATLEATQGQILSQSPTDATSRGWHLYGI